MGRGRTPLKVALVAVLSIGALGVGALGVELGRFWLNPPLAADEIRREGTLLIVGGGVTPPAVEKRLVQLAGGRKARIVVIPTAQAIEGKVDIERLAQPWRALGVASVTVLHAKDREEADDPSFAAPLAEATGVWICGGNQSRLARAYLDTEVEHQLQALVERGGVIGGTSAGAAIMTKVMILHGFGQGDVSVGRGFDLLPDAVVDQHFLQRSRVQRLVAVLEQNPGLIGFGIDAKTALEFHAGRIRVLGDSYVMAIVPDDDSKRFRFEILQPEEELTLAELRQGDATVLAATRALNSALGE